jgi:hypothetical protein
MKRKGLMAPPDDEQTERRRGLMAPDAKAAAPPVSPRAFLWAVAGVLALVELMLRALAG